jgi:acyl-coenzyme A synthetase/AMP-(fatty) acid ligase
MTSSFLNALNRGPVIESEVFLHHPSRVISRQDFLRWSQERSQFLRELSEDSGSPWGLPILVDDSVESFLTVATCLAEGIAFAPIDSAAPVGRLDSVVRIIEEPWLTLIPGEIGHLSLPDGIVAVGLDDDFPALPPGSKAVTKTNSGITILTSGSTGVPKGVHLPFGVLDQQVAVLADELGPNPSTVRLSSLAPLHFIAGIKRVLRGLVGAELHIFPPRQFTPSGLVSEFKRKAITHLNIPPQVARLIAHHRGTDLPVLEDVVELRIGSEGIRFETLQSLRRILQDDVVVRHGLGATEGRSGLRNVFRLGEMPPTGQVPVGRVTKPENIHFEPQPELGQDIWEVYVSGPITSGYVGNSELNATRFSTDKTGKRWWHSGDLVSLNEEGLYVHQGRKDDLVKVRGILASPSEATHALLSIPGVRAAIVLPHRENDNVRLVGHVQIASDSGLTLSDIREMLKKSLPDHLVPASLIEHDKMPTNSRGKIDRVALIGNPDSSGENR